jgi:integrase
MVDADCRAAKCPEDRKHVRKTDGAGLYLEVSRASKRWFWKYKSGGVEKRMALGAYDPSKGAAHVSLAQARDARTTAHQLLKGGEDPVQRKRAAKINAAVVSANNFAAVARDFHDTKKGGWSPLHGRHWLRAVERDLLPWIGALPVADITGRLLLNTLRKIEQRGVVNSAHDCRQYAGQVFVHAIAQGLCDRNPAADIRGTLKPLNVRHMSAVTDPPRLGELLRAIDGYGGRPETKVALVLSAMTFQRPGNVRMAEWAEIDLDAAMWTIPAAKMKRNLEGKTNNTPHLVPLAPRVVDMLRNDLLPLTGHGKFLFPSLRTSERPISDNTLNAALRSLGFGQLEMTSHGWRAVARTLLDEVVGVDTSVIEVQLAHSVKDANGRAYNRTQYLPQRVEMMSKWADYLDRLRVGAKVVKLRAS